MQLKSFKYLLNKKITIPTLKSRGGNGLTLPLMDHIKRIPLPVELQIIKLSLNEAGDLIRSWGKDSLEEVIEKKVTSKKEDVAKKTEEDDDK